jgi:glycosyltransferase involved in cell wall biosynthesis
LTAVRLAVDAGLDIKYTIAGDGPSRDDIVSKIEELGLGSHVTLAGTLSETEVFDLLSRADASVLPSTGLGEAWPVSVMEAMGAGLPVIASIIGATPEMITPGQDGYLIRQHDERALFETISLLARDVGARREVGAAARRTARERFDVSITARALLNQAQQSF